MTRTQNKWQHAAHSGFQMVPDILLKKQVELGLSATDMLVLMNITMHWWYAEQRPFPRTTTIARRMGVDERTVQRSMRKLIGLGLLEKEKEVTFSGTQRDVCDLSGLVERLGAYAVRDPDYRVRTEGKVMDDAAL